MLGTYAAAFKRSSSSARVRPHVGRRAVQAVKYFPDGQRGLAAGSRPANYGFGLSMSDYVVQANADTLVCVQLEEQEALQNIDEILRVEGVDVFFVGPSDLSQSMGYPGRSGEPVVKQAIDEAFAKIVAAGKAPGSAGNAQATRGYLEQGVQYLYTHLTTLLGSASVDFLGSVKP